MDLRGLLEFVFVGLLALGVFFAVVGSFGLSKLSDFMRRLHGPTKATTLGVGSVLAAAMLHHSAFGGGLTIRELLITVFLFLSAPVSAKLLGMAAMASDPSARPPPPPGAAPRGESPER